MSSRLTAFVAVLALASPSAGQHVDHAAIDREVQSSMRFWNVPGASVVVITNEKAYVKGYGVREVGKSDAVSADTVFPLASCTKAFTSLAVAMLVDDGKLSWDDPVRKHLPDFHLADPGADALVTVRDLLCHRTGVNGHDLLWYRAPWGQDETIRRIGKMPPLGPFRATFAYQSIMYMVAGKIVGKFHPQGWEGFVRQRILEPLRIAPCLTTAALEKCPNVAKGHRLAGGGIESTPAYPIPEPNPSGSVFISARDLEKWLRFQLGDGAAGRGNRLVKTESLEETHKPHTIIPMTADAKALSPETVQLSYAMGWIVQDYRGIKVINHGGWIDGFRCQLTLVPDRDLAIGVLCNLDGTRFNLALSNRLIDLVLELPEKNWNSYYAQVLMRAAKAKEDEKQRRDAARRPDAKPSLPLAAYAGEYEHPGYGVCTVRENSGRLTWEWSSFKEELDRYDGDTFEIHNPLLSDSLAAFRIADKKVTSLNVLDLTFKRRR
jgi:CubicO group peptidase (beta-lactamase class C family)